MVIESNLSSIGAQPSTLPYFNSTFIDVYGSTKWFKCIFKIIFGFNFSQIMGEAVKNTEILIIEETSTTIEQVKVEQLQGTTWLTDGSRKKAVNKAGFCEHSFKRVVDDAQKTYEYLKEHGKYANTYIGTFALDQGKYFN